MNTHISLLFVASIISDIDLLLPGFEHRGPTHSLILFLVIALPLTLLLKKRAIPYLVALGSHSFLGDYLTSPSGGQGVQLFFPLSSDWFLAGHAGLQFTFVYVELLLFAAFLTIMLWTRDTKMLMQPHPYNLLLLIPISTGILPVFMQFPLPVPNVLILPHIILIAIFTYAILIDVKHVMFSARA